MISFLTVGVITPSFSVFMLVFSCRCRTGDMSPAGSHVPAGLSDKALFGETEVAIADDYVIEDLDTKEIACLFDAPGNLEILT